MPKSKTKQVEVTDLNNGWFKIKKADQQVNIDFCDLQYLLIKFAELNKRYDTLPF